MRYRAPRRGVPGVTLRGRSGPSEKEIPYPAVPRLTGWVAGRQQAAAWSATGMAVAAGPGIPGAFPAILAADRNVRPETPALHPSLAPRRAGHPLGPTAALTPPPVSDAPTPKPGLPAPGLVTPPPPHRYTDTPRHDLVALACRGACRWGVYSPAPHTATAQDERHRDAALPRSRHFKCNRNLLHAAGPSGLPVCDAMGFCVQQIATVEVRFRALLRQVHQTPENTD